MISLQQLKAIVYNKLVYRTETRSYEELSEELFGEGNCYNESEVRKRMYGMKRVFEVMENQDFAGVTTKILSVSDLHIPFQLDISLLSNYVGKIDILQINGDVVDCQALSKFTKYYRLSPMEEIITARKYLIDLINYISPKKVVCNFGNHDKRLGNYLANNIDNDTNRLMPMTSLEHIFDDGFYDYDKQNRTKVFYEPLRKVFNGIVEIEFVNDWKSKIGKTWFVHPIAYKSGILSTADKAKAFLQDTEKEPFDCVVMAHTHNVGDSMKGYIRLLEQGAFAHVEKMDYFGGKLYSPQKSGFAIVCQDEEGNLIQDKTKVIVLS